LWGPTVPTTTVAASAYEMKREKVGTILHRRFEDVLRARSSWPRYATIKEDEDLRAEQWNNKYKGKRPILWDNMGIRLAKPSSALLQRLTFSSYYATNVGKGGVHQQYCGWMGTEELYAGFISDSDYFNNYEILKRQQRFQENDIHGVGLVKFLNILDRGYRSTRAAWRNGQFVYQPTFAKADRKFKAKETI
jgi:hypothetical protein